MELVFTDIIDVLRSPLYALFSAHNTVLEVSVAISVS